MKTIALSVSTDYVKDWGFWEMFREFAQNAMDAPNTKIVFNNENNSITLSNDGFIPESALVYGGGSKTEDKQSRGKHCEGLKNALLVAVRDGVDITFINRVAQWTPVYEYNTAFHTRTLKIEMRKCTGTNVCITLKDVSFEDMEVCRERLIDLGNEPEIVFGSVEEGYAFEPVVANTPQLFVGGLYVGDMPKSWYEFQEYRYSYNMPPALIQLDRDRNTMNEYELQRIIADILIRNNEIEMMVSLGYDNALDIEGYTEYKGGNAFVPTGISVAKTLAVRALDLFYEKNGDTAYPIDQGSSDIPLQMDLIKEVNMVPVLVPRRIYAAYDTKEIKHYGIHLPCKFNAHTFLDELLEFEICEEMRTKIETQLNYLIKYYPQ